MNQTPIIFLAYANDEKAYLDKLKEEIEGIRSALFEADDEGKVRIVYPVQNTSIKDIYNTFLDYKDRVVIFHYAGHANGERIFTHQQSTEASSLAKLFQERKALELVFLNGCSSKGQVEFFLNAGAKAVIATSGPVQDAKAKDLSIRFYQCLAKGDSIESAFKIAMSEHENHPKVKKNRGTHRFSDALFQDESILEIPWGLYQREDIELNWKIQPKSDPLNQLNWVEPNKVKKPINAHLIVPVFKAMDYPKKFIPSRPQNDQEKQHILRRVKDEIVAHFPYPIAISIRALFTPEMAKASRKRLHLIIGCYLNLSRLLSYILLAQLWNERLKKPIKFRLNIEFKQSYQQFRKLSFENYQHFNYGRFCNAITNVFWDNQVEPFIQESIHRSDDYQQAHSYLEIVRQQFLEGSITDDQITDLCKDAEYCLAIMLKEQAYLANFELLSVRDIKVQQLQRTQEIAAYDHSVGILLGDSAESSQYQFPEHTDSYSVLLIKSDPEDNTTKEYLNLCPFVIDENVFDYKSETPSLLFFAYPFMENQEFYYERVKVQGLSIDQSPEVKITSSFQLNHQEEVENAFEEDEYKLFGSDLQEKDDRDEEIENPLYKQIKSQLNSLDQGFKYE